MSGAAKVTLFDNRFGPIGAPVALVPSSRLTDEVWVNLEGDSKLTVRSGRGPRETTFGGPGRLRACVGRDEEMWLVQGTVESTSASGERPGDEPWVVTPAGVIRYGGAKLAISATSASPTAVARTEVTVTGGTAFVWTGDQASPSRPSEAGTAAPPESQDGWIRLEETQAVTLTPQKAMKPEEAARAAIERCTAEGTAARDLAAAVARPDAALAQIAPRHVIARHMARAACDVAALRVALVPRSPARAGLVAMLKEADSGWRAARPRPDQGRAP